MTNKSINLLKTLNETNKHKTEEILSEIVNIEFNKIKAQAKIFDKNSDSEGEHIKEILEANDSQELFKYLKELTIYQIALISSYGIEIEFMYLLKVSE